MELKCIAEYPGKIFFNDFGDFDNFNKYKKHYFLYGFTEDTDDLTPVHFTGKSLEPCDRETFEKDQIIRNTKNHDAPQRGVSLGISAVR